MNNKQWMVTPTFIDFNPNELYHCLFIISMDLCYGDELMNWFCGMVDQWKTLILVSSWNKCQRFSPLQIFDMPQAAFKNAQNLSTGFVELPCVVVITTTPLHHGVVSAVMLP